MEKVKKNKTPQTTQRITVGGSAGVTQSIDYQSLSVQTFNMIQGILGYKIYIVEEIEVKV